ncbi:MAG: hypothetical protein QM529_03830 [Hydrotalea sp.]|nr:hypothetical protein [Hydrotalea sp.]
MMAKGKKKPLVKNSAKGKKMARTATAPTASLAGARAARVNNSPRPLPAAPHPHHVIFRKGWVTLRDLKKKPIEINWQLQKSDKKQAEMLRAIEKRLRLIALDEFTADIKCEKLDNKVYYMASHWSAVVRQQCVITLDEFDEKISGDLHLDFIEERYYDEKRHKDVEPIAGDELDTLEQMVQELSLNLNPFPKKPGATIPVAFRAELANVNGLPDATPHQKSKTAAPTKAIAQQPMAKPFANLAEKLKAKNQSNK